MLLRTRIEFSKNIGENHVMTETMHIRFHLRAPVIVRRPVHLDAVIGSVIAGGTWLDDADFSDRMPIAVRDGVYLCSAGFWCGSPETHRVVFNQSITRPRDVESAMALTDIEPHNKFYGKVFGNRLSVMHQIATDHVDFLVQPKPDRLEDLVRSCLALPGLGRRARHGWGEIGGVSVAGHDSDPWVLPGTDEPIISRAVPMSVWSDSGINARYRLSYDSFAPPYHASGKTICAIPTGDSLIYDFHGEPV